MMELPTKKESLDYFKEYHVPTNIFAHCLKVQQVADFIATRFKGPELDKELINRLALLHDIFKMIAVHNFGTGTHKGAIITQEQKVFWEEMRKKHPSCYEGELAHEIFKDEFPELALALKNVSNPRAINPSWEEMIVHYADVRVFKKQVVLFQQRWEYLRERYPREDGSWDQCREFQFELEKKIFQHLEFTPEELRGEMGK